MSQDRSFLSIPWKRLAAWAAVALTVVLAYTLWSPGEERTDGAHDLGRNGIWLQHGWIGDDIWFATYKKEHRKPEFRDPERLAALSKLLAQRVGNLRDGLPPATACCARANGATTSTSTSRAPVSWRGLRVVEHMQEFVE